MNNEDQRGHMSYLAEIAQKDVETLKQKEAEYGSSWKKRGGVGAFMMLARKWDRLEQGLDPTKSAHATGDVIVAPLGRALGLPIPAFDILLAGVLDSRREDILDDIGDLRRYLLLVEAEIRRQQDAASEGNPLAGAN